METAEKKFINYRASQLAIVHLTRRDGIAVIRCPHYDGIDVVVSMLKQSGRDRKLGVVTKGLAPEPNGKFGSYAARLRAVQKRLSETENLDFPICLFVFDMITDEGQWRWLLKPVTDSSGQHLRANHDTALTPLTNEAVNAIVDAVNRWYDAEVFSVVAA